MTVHSLPSVTQAAEGLPRRRFTVAEVEPTVPLVAPETFALRLADLDIA